MNKWVSPLTGQLVEQEVAEAHAAELAAASTSYKADMVKHPDHYQGKDGLEVITVLRAFDLDKSFELGSAGKYLLRSGKKGKLVEDIRKAKQMLELWLAENDKESN